MKHVKQVLRKEAVNSICERWNAEVERNTDTISSQYFQLPIPHNINPVRPKLISTWKKVTSTLYNYFVQLWNKEKMMLKNNNNFMQIYNIIKNNNNKLYKHFLVISFKIMILHALYILMITNIYVLLAFYLLLFEYLSILLKYFPLK